MTAFKKISRDLAENLAYLEEKTGGDLTFDFLTRRFQIGGRDAALIYIDGFANGELMSKVLEGLFKIERQDICVDAPAKIIAGHLNALEIETTEDLNEGLLEVLSGPQLLLIDGEEVAIVIDAREWPARSPEEPELEKATRGPADGLGETLIFNLAAVRRRLRDPQLRVEGFKVGSRSQTDVALLYLADVANSDLVESIREKLQKIDTAGLPLADKTIEEFLTGNRWNPFPLVRFTERPDTLAAHLLEGHLIVMIDTSPTALILPAPFLSHTQSLEEYRQGTVIGTYLTFLRFLAIFISVILPPLWLVLAKNSQLLPPWLAFIGPKSKAVIPLELQFIMASFGIDLIRMASISTPDALATSLGLIGALFLGEFAVKVGLFVPEVILYIATAAVGTFSIPGFELSLLLQLLRLFLLVAVAFFNWQGLLGGSLLIFLVMALTKSFGVPYLWPLFPLNVPILKTFILRQSALSLARIPLQIPKTRK